MSGAAKFSLVVPCFNEKESIPILLEKYRQLNAKCPFQLILVNNGSTDGSDAVIREASASNLYPFVTWVEVTPNQGYGWGIMQGAGRANCQVIGFTHADLQCDPEDVLKAFELWGERGGGHCVVKGRRVDRRPDEKWISNKLDQIASVILSRHLEDINGQPKLFPKSFLDSFQAFPKDITFDCFLMGVAATHGMKVHEFPVYFRERQFGVSSWNRGYLRRWKTILSFLKTVVCTRLRIYR